MRKFKSVKQAQRFLSADRAYRWTFPAETARISHAGEYRALLQTRIHTWNEVTETKTAAEHCIVRSSSSASSLSLVLLFYKLSHYFDKLTIREPLT